MKDRSKEHAKKFVPRKQKLKRLSQSLTILSFIAIVVFGVSFFLKLNIKVSLTIAFIVSIFLFIVSHFRKRLKETAKIKKMENVFPDFLQLMSSNLRAGMTIDRAMLVSARKEFFPLDQEIIKTGRDITTGIDIEKALLDLAKRIGSEKISKTILLIISGIKAGGDVATILEETSTNMRERYFMEKKAISTVLMYMIFIFVAVSIGAPALFGLSNLLVDVLTTLLSGVQIPEAVNVPFTLSEVNISKEFILYFSVSFIVALDVMASLVLGLVGKGEEKQGFKFLIPLIILSLSVFFIIKFSLAGVISNFFN